MSNDAWDNFRTMLPSTFGKKNQSVNKDSLLEKNRRTDGILVHSSKKPEKISDYVEENISPKLNQANQLIDHKSTNFPISCEVKFEKHLKSVSTLAVDPAGARFASGSQDYSVLLWDFNGMDTSFSPFREVEPFSGYHIRDVKYSGTGDRILVVSGLMQAKILDRDGQELSECIKGDPYIRDMRNTKGHVAALTCCGWHPTDKDVYFTASMDSTIRVWNANQSKKQREVIVNKNPVSNRGRVSVTAAKYTLDGKRIICTTDDGTLRVWNTQSPFIKPLVDIPEAHMPGSITSGLCITKDSTQIATRGGDDCVKLWDLRYLKNQLSMVASSKDPLPNVSEDTGIIFSPDNSMILTGTSVRKNTGEYGKLVFLSATDLTKTCEVDISQSNCVSLEWHESLNQIFVGCGNGQISIFYDPINSFKGVKSCVVKEPKRRNVDDFIFGNLPVMTPHALPLFKDVDARSMKRKIEKMHIPSKGPSKGRIGSSMTEHLMKEIVKDTSREEDPRAALLKYAKAAEEDPFWVAPAYKKNQPNAVFAEDDKVGVEDEEETGAEQEQEHNPFKKRAV